MKIFHYILKSSLNRYDLDYTIQPAQNKNQKLHAHKKCTKNNKNKKKSPLKNTVKELSLILVQLKRNQFAKERVLHQVFWVSSTSVLRTSDRQTCKFLHCQMPRMPTVRNSYTVVKEYYGRALIRTSTQLIKLKSLGFIQTVASERFAYPRVLRHTVASLGVFYVLVRYADVLNMLEVCSLETNLTWVRVYLIVYLES